MLNRCSLTTPCVRYDTPSPVAAWTWRRWDTAAAHWKSRQLFYKGSDGHPLHQGRRTTYALSAWVDCHITAIGRRFKSWAHAWWYIYKRAARCATRAVDHRGDGAVLSLVARCIRDNCSSFLLLPAQEIATLLARSKHEVLGVLYDVHSIFDIPQVGSMPTWLQHPSIHVFLLSKERSTDARF